MVKKVYFEEIVTKDSIKEFANKIRNLVNIGLSVFNDRRELVFTNFQGTQQLSFLEELCKNEDLFSIPDNHIFITNDKASYKFIRLHFKDHLFGLAIIGPCYLVKFCNFENDNLALIKGSIKTNKIQTRENVKSTTAIYDENHKSFDLPVLTHEQLSATSDLVTQFFNQQVEIALERESLRRKEKILSVLEEASNIMNSNLDFQNLLEFLMDIAIDITGATCGAILLKREKKKYLEVVVARGKFPHEVKKIRVPLGQGVTGWVARNKEPLIVPNVLLEPRYIETPETIYSEMAVPMILGDRVIGVVVVDSAEINAFTQEDCQILCTLASMVTKVLENARLFSEARQKVHELSTLFTISEKLSHKYENIKAILSNVLSDIKKGLNCNGTALMNYNSEHEDLSILALSGLPPELENIRIPIGKGIHGWVALNKKPLLVEDATLDSTITKFSFLDQFAKSFICVPLQTNDRFIGVLGVYQKTDNTPFTESDLQLLTTISQLLTVFLENHRLFEDSKRKLEYFSTLYKVSSSVSSTLNISKLFEMILQQVQDVMNVENCSLMMYDPIHNQLTVDAAIGLPKDIVGKVRVNLGDGIAGWVAQNKQPVLIKDISKDPRFTQRTNRLDYKTRSVLSVPIIHKKNLLGVLNVNNKRSGEVFTEDDLNLLLGISGQISQAIANAELHDKTEQQVAELSLIQELGKAINSSLELDSVLNYFIDMTSRILEADRSSLMLYNEDLNELYVQVSRGFNEDKIKNIRFKVGEGVAGRVAETKRPIRIINTQKDPLYKHLPVSENKQPTTLIAAPLLNRDKLIGVINCERLLDKKGPFTVENLDLLDTLASQASVAIQNAKLYNNLLNYYFETIQALAAAIDAKDSYTHGHSRRVTDISIGIAQIMNLKHDDINTIKHAALLHDIGKIGISEQILLKPGRLTEEEYEKIKQHPHIGAGILNSIEFLKKVCEIIEHHHERYDGKGYPLGLKGDQIPLGARIICVADAFDAITSTRPYRKPLLFTEAIEEITKCSGTQFDPIVVDSFVKLINSEICPQWLKEGIQKETQANQPL